MQTNYEGDETDPNGSNYEHRSDKPEKPWQVALLLIVVVAAWWGFSELLDIPVNPAVWFQ